MVKKLDVEPILAACLLYVIIGPYFVWGILKIKVLYVLICSVVSLLFIKNNEIGKNTALFSYIFFVVIFYCLRKGLNINGFYVTSLGIFLPFGKELFAKKVFNCLINIYSVFIALSTIVWIFVLLNLVPSIGTLEPTDQFKIYNYNVYPFVIQINYTDFYRFCGLFDEPGVVGTFNAIFLYILGFKKDDWKTYALFLSGVLSFSLFFYLSVFAFFAINSILKLNLKAILLVVAFSFVFYGVTKDNVIISEMVWNRLEWDDSKGGIVGDNRVKDNAEELYNKKKYTMDYWFGTHNERELQYFEGSSTYKYVVLSCGMIFFVIYILFFALLALKYLKGKQLVLFLFLFLSTIYQRPWMFGMGYFFLFPYYAKSKGLLRKKI